MEDELTKRPGIIRAESIFDKLTPVDGALLAEFERAMTDEVIPEVVSVLRERHRLALENRNRLLE